MPERKLVQTLERAAERVDGWLEANYRIYLGICVLLSLVTFSGYSHVKSPWIDEIFQLTVARLPTLHGIWNATMDGIIAEPPVVSSVQHYLLRAFGDSMFIMRLPAILGFTVGCLALVLFARIYMSPLYAASVFFIPYATMMRWRAMDARPYGLMFGFTALTLLCWDRMGRERNRRNAWRIAFTLSLAALNSTHFYSILVLLPISLGEITRWWRQKRIEWATVLCVAIATIPYIFWLQILVSVAKEYMVGFPYRVSFTNLWSLCSSAIDHPSFAIGLVLVFAAMALHGFPLKPASRKGALYAPALICAGFLFMPVVGFIAGLLVTGVFVPYHYMVAAVGIVIGVPLALSAMSNNDRLIGLALLVTFAGYGLMVTARGISGYVRRETPYPSLAELRKVIPETHPDIVVPSLFEFLPFQETMRADPQNNLIYLYDSAKALGILQVNTLEIIALHMRDRTQARIEPFDGYRATHDHFYTASSSDPMGVWLTTYLAGKSGDKAVHITPLGTVGRFEINRVDLGSAAQSH